MSRAVSQSVLLTSIHGSAKVDHCHEVVPVIFLVLFYLVNSTFFTYPPPLLPLLQSSIYYRKGGGVSKCQSAPFQTFFFTWEFDESHSFINSRSGMVYWLASVISWREDCTGARNLKINMCAGWRLVGSMVSSYDGPHCKHPLFPSLWDRLLSSRHRVIQNDVIVVCSVLGRYWLAFPLFDL